MDFILFYTLGLLFGLAVPLSPTTTHEWPPSRLPEAKMSKKVARARAKSCNSRPVRHVDDQELYDLMCRPEFLSPDALHSQVLPLLKKDTCGFFHSDMIVLRRAV